MMHTKQDGEWGGEKLGQKVRRKKKTRWKEGKRRKYKQIVS